MAYSRSGGIAPVVTILGKTWREWSVSGCGRFTVGKGIVNLDIFGEAINL
jgi:hypothetical protein